MSCHKRDSFSLSDVLNKKEIVFVSSLHYNRGAQIV